jgi:ribosomal protein S18 acetylase RimI-like enzyme
MIDKFVKFSNNHKFKVLEFTPKYQPNEYFIGYRLLLNSQEMSHMVGYKKNNSFNLTGLGVSPKFSGKGMGEILILEYLKKYGGYVFSRGGRTDKSEKMWSRIIKRDDVNVEIIELTNSFKSYRVSLK